MGLTFHSYEPTLNGEGRELVVRKDVVQNGVWDSKFEGFDFANSTIGSWCNGTYKNQLPSPVQTAIATTKFYYSKGGDDTPVITAERAVFVLSVTELGFQSNFCNVEGTALPTAQTIRATAMNGSANDQWTRSPNTAGNSYPGAVFFVNASGTGVDDVANNQSHGYRPCFCLPATARVNNTFDLMEESLST